MLNYILVAIGILNILIVQHVKGSLLALIVRVLLLAGGIYLIVYGLYLSGFVTVQKAT